MMIQSIQFHDQTIQVLQHEGRPYVAMKSICENIGLDWRSQRQRILRHEALSKGVVMMTTPSKGGAQETMTLPLGYLNGWLFGIETSRVKKEIQPILKLYQMECYDVLYNHFLPEVAAVHPNTIDTEQQHEIKSLVNEVSRKTGIHYQGVYTRLYEKFKIPRYQELPTRDYQKAVDYLSSLITPNEDFSKKQKEQAFIVGILRAGNVTYHNSRNARDKLLDELACTLEKVDKHLEEVREIGRKIRYIEHRSGVIHDATAEPFAFLDFDKATFKAGVELSKKLVKPLNLEAQ